MTKKRKIIIIAIIIIVALLLLFLHILFLGKNEKYDFVPFVLGSFSVFGIYIVKNIGNKPDEWNPPK